MNHAASTTRLARRTLTGTGIVALISAGPLLLAAWGRAGGGDAAPNTTPPIPGQIANSVFAFGSETGHPEFAVLRDNRTDAAAYAFGHKNHNDPEKWGRMQEALGAIKKGESPAGTSTGRAGHIEERNGKFFMSCTFCHEPDTDGGLMKPVDFETHCVDCHTGTLGFVGASGEKIKLEGTAKKLVRAQAIPHGSSAQVAELVDKAIAQFIADDPPQFPKVDPNAAPPAASEEKKEEPASSRRRGGGAAKPAEEAKPAEPAAQPEESGGGGGGSRRRGGTAGGADPRKPADTGPTAKLPAFADKPALAAWSKELRTEILSQLKDTNCGLCHTNSAPGPAEAPELFTLSTATIPDRWFTKARFAHGPHSMVSCASCHHDAVAAGKRFPGILASDKTADINIPGIASCRECHAPTGTSVKLASGTIVNASGAPHDCVLCHTYHEKPPQAVMGSRSIEQVRRGGRGAPSATLSTPTPPAPASNPAPSPAQPAAPAGSN